MRPNDKCHTLKVCETFVSLQGEGRLQGYPCFFIRLTGCNLRCRYCDTTYSFSGGRDVHVHELVSLWKEARVRPVLITGGEPLLQAGVTSLLDKLTCLGAKCLLETNGTLDISTLPKQTIKILDWKTPGSGHGESFLESNLRYLSSRDQIKFVITSRDDYLWSRELVRQKGLNYLAEVVFSPASGYVSNVELAQWILADRMPVRFQIQLHKLLWGDKPGV